MNKREKIVEYRYYDEDLNDWIEDDQLDNTLNEIALNTGWIIIEFNSLEASINYNIEQLLSHSEGQDEIVNIFLSEMNFNSKQSLLIKIYGYYIFHVDQVKQLKADLGKLESKLIESGQRRNRYAHADFSSISKKKFVKVKTKSKKDGVYHTFVKFDRDDMRDDLKFIRNTFEELQAFDEKFIHGMYDMDWDKYNERFRELPPTKK